MPTVAEPCWQPELETLPPDRLRAEQERRFRATLDRARQAPFYRDRLASAKVAGLADLASLPFTTKDDLRNNFPYGFAAVPRDQLVRLHSSSGTTGNPTVIYHTAGDVAAWADLIARCLWMAGLRPGDVFQNTMGYGLFTGGLGFHYGAERLGLLTIPIGPGNSPRQLWFMRQFGTTAVHILPSYALRLHSHLAGSGIDRADLKLRVMFVGAEPHSEELRRQIESLWGVTAFNSYGLSEMCGPGIAFECPEQNGMHLWEDAVYAEVVDPATGRALPDGEEGELVLTTLTREANPLLRYRTRDLTRILPGPCRCGRTHRRIERITGRTDDMLIINGVNIFPIQIEQTVLRVPQVGNNYLIELRKERYMDRVVVKLEVREELFAGTLTELEKLQATLAAALRAELGFTVDVKLVEPGSLPVAEGKAQRVRDLRAGEGRG